MYKTISFSLLAILVSVSYCQNLTNTPTPVLTHPRLFLTQDDLPRLRSWARSDNPVWQNGIWSLAQTFKNDVDLGRVPNQDTGASAWVEYPTEKYAEVFAFISLVHPNITIRNQYGQLAKDLLMHIFNIAVLGQAEVPFRFRSFSSYDRSRWWGTGYANTIDWVYDRFSVEEKATIRTVALRWVSELVAGYNQNPSQMRWQAGSATPMKFKKSMNNFQIAQMRQIGMLAAVLDPADDANNELRSKLQIAEDYLWAADIGLKTYAPGGLAPEGILYGPSCLGRFAQFALVLANAGLDDTQNCSCRLLENNPFWNKTLAAYFHSLSNEMSGSDYYGNFHELAWYGDGIHTEPGDPIDIFGPLSLYYQKKGIHPEFVEHVLYLEKYMLSGGAAGLAQRARSTEHPISSILLFMIMRPDYINTTHVTPRPLYGLNFFAPGIQRILSRTSWNTGATWFTYKLGWNNMDHQHGDGNMFELYRKGEWLTKERTGYGVKIGSSDYKNTLSLENDPSSRPNPDFAWQNYERGSQYYLSARGDGVLIGYSFGDNYTYALGDSTQLYNSDRANSTNILHASRSIVWLKPDIVVTYDRATSATAGRFKRFWLNTPTLANVSGNVAVAATPKGQKLVLTNLLPQGAQIIANRSEYPHEMSASDDDVADGFSMDFRIRIDAPGNPADARFLNVLQGADGNATAIAPTLIQSSSGTNFSGVVIGDTVILFPISTTAAFTSVTYTVPSNVTTHYVTGVPPSVSYGISIVSTANGLAVTVSANGNTQAADAGGVLLFKNAGSSIVQFTNTATGGNSPVPAPPVVNVPATNTTSTSSSGSNSTSTSNTTSSSTNTSSGTNTTISNPLNGRLSSLTIGRCTLSPAFDPLVTDYAIPSDCGPFAVTAILANTANMLYINGNPKTSGVAYTANPQNGVITVRVYRTWSDSTTYNILVQSN